MPTLWIVHRDAGRRAVLARLAGAGEDTILGDPADRLFEGSPPADVVLLGLTRDFEEELEFAHRYAPRLGSARWLLITEGQAAADARRLFDTLDAEIIAFPPSAEDLRQRLRSALTRRDVEPLSERRARDAIAARFARWFSGLELPELLRALDPRLARTPVLIRGEHGTGRTLLALYLHTFGGTTGGALAQISCAPVLTADELVARVGSAARSDRARRSLTVVLEDVDRLSPAIQREVRGWIELAAPPPMAHSAWVRWIGTLSDPADGSPSRLDSGLCQALSGIPITLPPLRASPERAVGLADLAARAFCESTGSRPRHFSPEALEALAQHPWPGNLRELEGVVTRTLAATSSELIQAASLRFESEPLLAPVESSPEREAPPSHAVPAEQPPEAEPAAVVESPELETWRLMDAAEAEPAPLAGTPESDAPAPPTGDRRAAPAELVGDRTLRRFLAALSQELGSPVVPLRTAAALLPERLADPAFGARFGELVHTDSRRTEEVITRLTRFAAFSAPGRHDVDLSALFDDLVEAQRAELEAHQILLLRELERSQPRVLGDAQQLRFALEALLRKALQLVKPRGDLYLASRFHPHGLRGAESIRVLLRFQSTARITPVAAAEGAALSETALDLLLIEAVVRAHGGRFTLDAAEGAETVILIDLPAPRPTSV